MLLELLLPIILSAIALFFASFLSWMVLPLHFRDWVKCDRDEDLTNAVRDLGLPAGSYMFPGWNTPEEMKSPEYVAKWEKGPVGIMTVFPKVSMGQNLGLTFLYFLAVSFCLAYLASFAVDRGADFMHVFRFVATAGLMAFLAAILQHAIWFHNRIIGHIIESVAYAVITGAIFAAMWPGFPRQ
jgi:hypothetical protein